MIAALYVVKGGCYSAVPAVDAWDRERDARLYAGPWPVVAHPPCERWGRYWGGAPSTWPRLILGDDQGCFSAALDAVRQWGGILEHPEGSHAWRRFQLNTPPRAGGWVNADFDLPSLLWGKAPGDFVRIDEGFHSIEERKRAIKADACQRLSKNQRMATPIEFRDLLISIAETAAPVRAAA